MARVRFALRTLFKSPFVTIVAIVSLALGIGANAAIFSLFNQILLRALPVQEPGQLVNLGAPGPKRGSTSSGTAGPSTEVFSYPMFRDLERQQTSFTGIAAHVEFGANLAFRNQTMTGEGLLVSGSYFPVLGVQPALGRLLTPADDRVVGEPAIAVLSHTFWKTRFAQDLNVLNTPITVNGRQLTIVGVAPREFHGTTIGLRPDVYVPITMRRLVHDQSSLDDRQNYWAYLFARLKPGVTIDEARVQVNVPYRAIINDVEAPLQKGMSEQTLQQFKAKAITVVAGERGQSDVHREAAAPLTLLLGVTALVLLIACANIANLLLARSAARAAEMAVRLSIGASRRQLIGQLLLESCLLAAFGGMAGLVAAHWILAGILGLLPADAGNVVSADLDARVVLFTAAVTIGTGVLFGLFPALHSTRPDLISTLKGQAGQPAGARAASRFRTTLATVQIALSMLLLASAGLLTKSLFNVSRIDLGLEVDDLVTFTIAPARSGYTLERSLVLFERLEDELRAFPGVTAVTASAVPLLAGNNWGNNVSVQGFDAGPDTDAESRVNVIGAGYFRTMGIPLIAGREFTASDARSSTQVVIVNEAFARKFNLGRDAVGKRMARGRTTTLNLEIVGVVQDAKYSQVKADVPPQFFRPYRQDSYGRLTFYVRTSTDPRAFLANIPKVLARLDSTLPYDNLRTMTEQVSENVFLDRFISLLSASFAILATLLAAIGLYGVLAFTVTQRTREIGLRMALGAAPARVRAMILRQVAWMTLAGGAIGLSAAVYAGQAAQSLLFQLKGYDPVVLAGSAAVLTLVALGAGFLPAHRASRVDPMLALRYE